MRRWWIAGLGILGLLVVLLLISIVSLRSARPRRDGELRVAGLSAAVEILRDSMGVAFVRAQTDRDLFFAQGFVHAQERLWQMDLARRVAQGRLAEAFGQPLAETDHFLRTVGLWRASMDQAAALDPDSRRILEAYTAGVNAAVAAREGQLPPEFLALGIDFEPWSVLHSVAMEKVMAWDLTLQERTFAAARAARLLDATRVRFLDPAFSDSMPAIRDPVALPEIPAPAAAWLGALSLTGASNAWVIGGERTRSGRPIVANDMHLALRAPAPWYLMALQGGDYDVVGLTLPGVPLVIAGRNRAVAWGFTNASLDDVDLYLIRRDPADAARYLTKEGSERFRVVVDTLSVRGRAEPLPFAIQLTRHGPVLPSFGETTEGDLIALRWAAHDPSHTAAGIAALNRAGSAADVVTAVRALDGVHQNVVYADTAGNFGYVMAGRIPVRGGGLPPPTLPVPGWTGEWDWTGYLSPDTHPGVRDPAEGFVVTANDRPANGVIADIISGYYEMPYRAARIRELIGTRADLTADAVHQMQLDVRDLLAGRYRELAVAAAHAVELPRNARALETWDLRADAEARGAALFYTWYERFRVAVRADLYGAPDGWLPRDAFNAILDSAALPWHGDAGSAAFHTLSRVAALEADSLARGALWGDLHVVTAEHALHASTTLDRLLRLSIGPRSAAGSPTTVDVSHHDAGPLPWQATAGPSERHVIDLGDGDAGGFILPTGQSGLPFERHYRDMWSRWLEGGLWPIPMDPAHARARAVQSLVLRPAPP